MDADLLARIQANPKYQALKNRRTRFGWSLTVVMLVAYFGYIGLIAFDKAFLATPIGAGVTSLGVPLTHRAHAHGVLFITGHAKQDATDAVDWAALSRTAAQAKLTLVIYMGVSGAAQLQEALLQSMRADTPVAVIHQVSLPTQRHVVCELQELHDTIVREQLASPSVIVIGDVFKGLLAMQSGSELQASAG